tara:strand:+ start:237 stop:905 length:669 start_codon:yes stop_codon:yes gene_type:complete
MNNPIIFLSSFLLIIMLTTFNPSNSDVKVNFFQIKKIEIINNKILKDNSLLNLFDIEFKGSSLLFINNKKVNEILKDNLLIKRVELKKIYPNKLQIKVHEKEPIAIINKKEGRLYLTQTGEEIKFFKNSKLKDLPNIFGKQKNFIKIYSSLKNLQFPISEIKSFYYFDIGRWDIITKNKIIIKLPVENFNKSLKNYMSIKNNINFENYKIFDYRIEDQLILN